MLRSGVSTSVPAICLLLLFLTLSGCGESATRKIDEATCRSRCSGLQGDDYRHCHNGCMFEQGVERSRRESATQDRERREKARRETAEKEQAEFDKTVMDKLIQGRQK